MSLAVDNEDFQLVDNIDIVRQMQYGEDYGFNRLDAYPITDWLNDSRHKGGMLKVRLSVDEHVFWDVDEIRTESIVLKRSRWKESFLIVIGAFIGITTDLFAGLIIATMGVFLPLVVWLVPALTLIVIWLLAR